jgi:hypothetical protein
MSAPQSELTLTCQQGKDSENGRILRDRNVYNVY